MNRFKRIAHRGWLQQFVAVATFGYYPASEITIIGKICAAITMVIPGATFAIAKPSATVTLTTTGATIELEDCT